MGKKQFFLALKKNKKKGHQPFGQRGGLVADINKIKL
jgi:hypothetical protein